MNLDRSKNKSLPSRGNLAEIDKNGQKIAGGQNTNTETYAAH